MTLLSSSVTADKRKLLLKWADALDSGKYNQCASRLIWPSSTGSPSYCCLGVMCELAKEIPELASTATNDLEGQFAFPSNIILERFGIRNNRVTNGTIDKLEELVRDAETYSLSKPATAYLMSGVFSDLNDVSHKDFKQIALLIRTLVQKLEAEDQVTNDTSNVS